MRNRTPITKKRIASLTLIALIVAVMTVTCITPVEAAGNPSSKVSLKSHEIKFSRIINARDLGGYVTKDGRVVKKGMLIRCGELSYASKSDIKKLRKTYNVGKVIDLRYKADRKYCPDKKIKGAKNICIPASKGNGSKSKAKKRYRYLKKKGKKKLRSAVIRSAGKASSSYTYRLVNSSYSKKKYRRYFKQLLSNKKDRAVVFHCIYGKDRTGVAAFMTLVALGVPEKTAYKEFTLTNAYCKKYSKRYKGKGVRTKDLKKAVRKAKKKYGSMDRFLKKAYGLDAAKRKKLKKMYTEPAAN